MFEVNGLSEERLYHRAIPLVDRTQDPIEWKYRSADGFIKENESIENLCNEDIKNMEYLGYTKESFANFIIFMMNVADNVIKGMNIPYDFTYKGNRLRVQKNIFMSPQYSLFYNENIKESQYNESWNTEYHFINLDNHLEIKIGGNQEHGLVNYIKWIGFCEGGHPSNLYRVDPYILLGVLKGYIELKTITIFKEREEYQINKQKEELNEYKKMKNEIEKSKLSTESSNKKNQEELKIIENQIESLQNIISLKQDEMNKIITNLKNKI